MFPNYNKVLYPDSPFMVHLDIQSVFRISNATTSGARPAIAIAHEMLLLGVFQSDLLDKEHDWVIEKFRIDEEGIDLYFYGLITPPNLIVAVDRLNFLTDTEAVDSLMPPYDDEMVTDLRAYLLRSLTRVQQTIDFNLYYPLHTAKPAYDHCGIDVFSENFWYLTGIEASRQTYYELCKLFLIPEIEETLNSPAF